LTPDRTFDDRWPAAQPVTADPPRRGDRRAVK
jgi:hypothetical protein